MVKETVFTEFSVRDSEVKNFCSIFTGKVRHFFSEMCYKMLKKSVQL